MKRALLVAMGMFLVTAGALAQGNVLFQSKNANPVVNFKILNPDGTVAEGGGKYTVELWGAPGATGGSLAPLMGIKGAASAAPIQTLLSGTTGYFAGGSWSVNGLAADAVSQFQVVVFETQYGSYDKQTAGFYGKGEIFNLSLTAPPATPAAMIGGKDITLVAVPEPSILALGVLGLGAFMLRRRS